ncbi:MAG: hypothetical protein GEU26_09690 [Nitrososphaeraceae archaeon]|nr:hypothetical protein [Nitrososphaeraceae archaeon]
MSTSRKIDLEYEPLMLKLIEEAVIGCNIGFISRVLAHVHPRLDQILSPNRKFSRPSDTKNRINEERKSHPKNDIDGNSDGMTFQWRIVKG